MKKFILAAALVAPFAAAPAFAQVEATPQNTVTQYQQTSAREFTARRAPAAAPAVVNRAEQMQIDRQAAGGNF